MKTLKEIKALAHSLLESHLDKSAQGLMKPSGYMTEWEMSNFLVGLEDIGEAIFDFKDESDHEEMTNLEAAAFIAEARQEIENGEGAADE